jgi:hypothetical protein
MTAKPLSNSVRDVDREIGCAEQSSIFRYSLLNGGVNRWVFCVSRVHRLLGSRETYSYMESKALLFPVVLHQLGMKWRCCDASKIKVFVDQSELLAPPHNLTPSIKPQHPPSTIILRSSEQI